MLRKVNHNKCPHCNQLHVCILDKGAKIFLMLILGGLLGIYIYNNYLFVNFNIPSNHSFVEPFISVKLTNLAHDNDYFVRSYGVNLTRNCGDDRECYARQIYLDMIDYDYVYSGNLNYYIYPPQVTITTRAGDCKNMAVTFCSLTYNLGVDCHVLCNMKHCYNMLRVKDGILIVDTVNHNYYWKK